MKYGIWVKVEGFAIYKDGSRKKVNSMEAWYADKEYDTLKAAKESLAMAKDILKEDFFDVSIINSVTIVGVHISTPCRLGKHEERVTYHIEQRR